MCFHMGELTHLADELQYHESVSRVDERGEVVAFDVDRGEYDSLSSKVVSTLGRYDAELYTFPEEEYKYRLVAP
jgi:hypothetical protein